MRGLLPSKGLAQARSMALFSDVLSMAVGFSGAWGSCLQGGDRPTLRNKRFSLVASNPPCAAERSLLNPERFNRGIEEKKKMRQAGYSLKFLADRTKQKV